MIDILIDTPEFEQKPYREKEQKFLPLFPERLEKFRAKALPVEQFYLSHPDEPFNLRCRESCTNDGVLRYEATLKDRGEITHDGLDRLEVTTTISPEFYRYYQSNNTPLVRKLRYTANANVSVDFFEDGRTLVESEHPIAWASFLDRHMLVNQFAEVTGDKTADNEWSAHLDYRRRHDGREAFELDPMTDPKTVAIDILNTFHQQSSTVVQVAGRSGSGKSTFIHELKDKLRSYDLKVTCLSTDDYHRGASWLRLHNNGKDWTNWDAPVVYDTAALAKDIRSLQNGISVVKRTIDFATVEPTYEGVVEPSQVIIIEGIYSRSPELAALSHLAYELPTPLATCIGRRLLRDIKERPQFADPKISLRYMLEQAEPSYRAQGEQLSLDS